MNCKKKKKKVLHNNLFLKNMGSLHFIPNNILTKFFKELKKNIKMTINSI